MFSVKPENISWKNWAETVYNTPGSLYHPSSITEIVTIVKACQAKQQTLRVIGAGHSFTPLAASGDVLLSLDQLTGIAAIDHENSRVSVWAGTRLDELGVLLHEQGYAMENLGDINAQAIAGAISTGTHGTGQTFGSLSTQVSQLTIVTGDGTILDISPHENNDYFQAARLSLGMLGVIVKIELNVVKAYQLTAESFRLPFEDCLSRLEQLKASHRNFEFYWFPHTNIVQGKVMNKPDTPQSAIRGRNAFSDIVIENGAFWMLSELCRTLPGLSKSASKLSANVVPTGKSTGQSHDMYATPRFVKFTEMEYSVPQECMKAIIHDIKHVIEKHNFNVHFPIECRYVKQDDIWLSPAFGQDSAYIAIHMYKGMPYQDYFDAIEEVFRHYKGRPHWGKMHSMTKKDLEHTYPKLQDFLQIRKELDPNGIFLNTYLRELFGI